MSGTALRTWSTTAATAMQNSVDTFLMAAVAEHVDGRENDGDVMTDVTYGFLFEDVPLVWSLFTLYVMYLLACQVQLP